MKNTGLEYASAERTPTVLAEMAELLPPLSGEQLAALEQDLLRNGCYTTAFVLGNHENYDAYKDYPKEEWHGGQIQRIRPSVLHLMRGQVYELNGRKFFTMGGASSHDIQDGILEPDDPDFEEKF